MKRIYAYIVLALCLAVSSCTNEDLPVTAPLTINVNTASVIDPFTYQVKRDELYSVPSGYKIRTCIYMYYGTKWICSHTSYSNTYNHTITFVPDWKEMPGYSASYYNKFRIITFSTVVKETATGYEDLMWSIQDHKDRSKFRIMYNTNYVGSEYAILGLDVRDVDLKETNEVNINLAPYGSLFVTYYYNIHTFDNVKKYFLASKRRNSSVGFSSGTISYYTEAADGYIYLASVVYPEDHAKVNNVYSYNFYTPKSDVSVYFMKTQTDDENYWISKPTPINFEKGEEHYFGLNLHDTSTNPNGEITWEYKLINASKATDTPSAEANAVNLSSLLPSYEEIMTSDIQP